MRLTEASMTPGDLVNVRWTRAWHAAHVIPVTGRVIRSAVPAADRVRLDAEEGGVVGAMIRPVRNE
jgi:hypothetical protein